MGKEIKYYTPSIEDLYIGYECEMHMNLGFESFNNNEEIWKSEKITLDNISMICNCANDNTFPIRTKYLDYSDITNEGFESYIINIYTNTTTYLKNNLAIKHDAINHTISTHIIDPIKYNGLGGETEHITLNCPSINEFRKIIKLLTYNG